VSEEIPIPSTWEDLRQGSEIVENTAAWGLVGQGKRFEAWAAWSFETMTPVCIKIPRRDALNEKTLDALQRELDVLAAVNHPTCPRLFGHDLDAERPWVMQEWLEGTNLEKSVEVAEQSPDPALLLFLGMQIAAGLGHIHQRGHVHLDLKPANLMLHHGRIRIFDFDVSMPIGGSRSTTKPRGTHCWMAPEQVRCEPAHPAMDVFALGVILRWAVSGTNPYVHEDDAPAGSSDVNPKQRAYRQADGPVQPACEAMPDLDPAFGSALDTLMAFDPVDRPSSTDEALLVMAELMSDNKGPPGSTLD